MTKEEIEQFVKDYMNSHEEDTFIKNEHGNFMYYSENGVSGVNLIAFFEDLLSEYSAQLASDNAKKDAVYTELKQLADEMAVELNIMLNYNEIQFSEAYNNYINHTK